MASPVAAQTPCGPHDGAVAMLASEYGEHRHAVMLDAAGAVVELFGADGGTWTILRTVPGGATCIVLFGAAFDPTRDPLPPQGERG